MNNPIDISKGVLLDFGKIIGLVTIGIFIGKSMQADSHAQEDIIINSANVEKAEKRVMDYVRDEVGGLRSDWDRDREDQNRRLEKLEK